MRKYNFNKHETLYLKCECTLLLRTILITYSVGFFDAKHGHLKIKMDLLVNVMISFCVVNFRKI